MKKVLSIALVLILMATLLGCSEKNEIKPKEDILGLTMMVKDVTSSGCTIVFKHSGGDVTGNLQTGEPFVLMKKVEGVWQELSTNPLIDYAWKMIAYMIEPNGETSLETKWEWLYGKLYKGEYKIIKEVMDFRMPGDYDTYEYSAEFVIE